MYKVFIRFDFQDKPLMLYAKEVDFRSMPIVYVKEITKGLNSTVLIIKDDAFEYFKDTKTLILPYTQVVMVQELRDGIPMDTDRGDKPNVFALNNKI